MPEKKGSRVSRVLPIFPSSLVPQQKTDPWQGMKLTREVLINHFKKQRMLSSILKLNVFSVDKKKHFHPPLLFYPLLSKWPHSASPEQTGRRRILPDVE